VFPDGSQPKGSTVTVVNEPVYNVKGQFFTESQLPNVRFFESSGRPILLTGEYTGAGAAEAGGVYNAVYVGDDGERKVVKVPKSTPLTSIPGTESIEPGTDAGIVEAPKTAEEATKARLALLESKLALGTITIEEDAERKEIASGTRVVQPTDLATNARLAFLESKFAYGTITEEENTERQEITAGTRVVQPTDLPAESIRPPSLQRSRYAVPVAEDSEELTPAETPASAPLLTESEETTGTDVVEKKAVALPDSPIKTLVMEKLRAARNELRDFFRFPDTQRTDRLTAYRQNVDGAHTLADLAALPTVDNRISFPSRFTMNEFLSSAVLPTNAPGEFSTLSKETTADNEKVYATFGTKTYSFTKQADGSLVSDTDIAGLFLYTPNPSAPVESTPPSAKAAPVRNEVLNAGITIGGFEKEEVVSMPTGKYRAHRFKTVADTVRGITQNLGNTDKNVDKAVAALLKVIAKASPAAFANLRIVFTKGNLPTKDPNVGGAYNSTDNILFLNTDLRNRTETKNQGGIVGSLVHEMGHFVEVFYLNQVDPTLVTNSWLALSDQQRSDAHFQYSGERVEGAKLKNRVASRSEWVAMSFARVAAGDVGGSLPKKMVSAFRKAIIEIRSVLRAWLGTADVANADLDKILVRILQGKAEPVTGLPNAPTETKTRKAAAGSTMVTTRPVSTMTGGVTSETPEAALLRNSLNRIASATSPEVKIEVMLRITDGLRKAGGDSNIRVAQQIDEAVQDNGISGIKANLAPGATTTTRQESISRQPTTAVLPRSGAAVNLFGPPKAPLSKAQANYQPPLTTPQKPVFLSGADELPDVEVSFQNRYDQYAYEFIVGKGVGRAATKGGKRASTSPLLTHGMRVYAAAKQAAYAAWNRDETKVLVGVVPDLSGAPNILSAPTAPKTAQFEVWFGDSVVVDSAGNPLPMYHGTSLAFEYFDPNTLEDKSDWGSHFTPSPVVAELFTANAGVQPFKIGNKFKEGANIMPVFVRIENPYRFSKDTFGSSPEAALATLAQIVKSDSKTPTDLQITDVGFEETWADKLAEAKRKLEDGDYTSPREVRDIVREFYAQLTEKFKDAGYDGYSYPIGVTSKMGTGPLKGVNKLAFATFDAQQVKSAYNERPTEGPLISSAPSSASSPKLDPQVQRDVEMTQGTRASSSKVLDGSLAEFLNRVQEKYIPQVVQGVFDKFYSLRLAEIKTFGEGVLDASVSAWKAALFTQNIKGVMSSVLNFGPLRYISGGVEMVPAGNTVDITVQTGTDAAGNAVYGKKTLSADKGLVDIVQVLFDNDLVDEFGLFATANRSKRLLTEGREKLMDADMVDRTLTRLENQDAGDGRTFRQVFEEYQAFNTAILNFAESMGVIDPEKRKVWEAYGDYVPFYRVAEEAGVKGLSGAGGLNFQVPGSRRLKGGSEKVSIIENMVLNAHHLVDASFKNLAKLRTADLLKNNPDYLTPIPRSTVPFSTTVKNVNAALDKLGLAFTSSITPENKNEIVTMFQSEAPSGPDVMTVLRNGKPEYYRINDPLLVRSINGLGPRQTNLVLSLMTGAKSLFTKTITLDPVFMAANSLRDSLSAWVVSDTKLSFSMLRTSEFMRSMRNDPAQLAIIAQGGGAGGFYSSNQAELRSMLRTMTRGKDKAKLVGLWKTMQEDGFKQTIIDSKNYTMELIHRLGRASEMMNRIAIYDSVLAKGGTNAEAVSQAQDLLNFSMRGDHAFVSALVDVLPFFNARLQGLYKLARSSDFKVWSETPEGKRKLVSMRKDFAVHGSMLMFATLGLYAMNKRDKRYDELPEWDRDTYFHVFLDNMIPEDIRLKTGIPAHIRIPKPFEIGLLFSTVPERLVGSSMGDEDWTRTWDAITRGMRDTLAFDWRPQILKPAFESGGLRSVLPGSAQEGGFDSFRGIPVESQADLNVDPEQRYDAFTAQTFIRAAEAMPNSAPEFMRSPKQLEFLTRGYFGTLGVYATDISDMLINATLGKSGGPTTPSKGVRDVPILGTALNRFAPDYAGKNSRFISEFYELYSEVDQTYRTAAELTDRGQREKVLADPALSDAYVVQPVLYQIKKSMADLRKQSQEVMKSDAPDTERRAKLDALAQRRNELARSAVERFGNL